MWMEREGEEAGGAVPFVSITFISQVIFDAHKTCAELSANWAQPLLSERIDVAVVVFSGDEGSSQAENSADDHKCGNHGCVCAVVNRVWGVSRSSPHFVVSLAVWGFSLSPCSYLRCHAPPSLQACEISPLFLRRYSYLSFLHLHQLAKPPLSSMCHSSALKKNQ